MECHWNFEIVSRISNDLLSRTIPSLYMTSTMFEEELQMRDDIPAARSMNMVIGQM